MQQQQQIDLQNGPIAVGSPGGGGTSGGLSSSPPGAFGTAAKRAMNGGRFDFEDGGTYCGGWEEGKAHGHGVCTGPKHQGAYAGAWNYGFEASGVYIWPSGSSFEGQWQNGRRHGLGVEQRGRLIYRGEWTAGYKGRYGVRQSATSTAKYEGTWASGLQDGYGSETYADGGSYQGQWQEGKRHGYGVRTSAPFGLASHYRPKSLHTSTTSLTNENADPSDKRNHRMEDIRGGFVLRAKSDDEHVRRNSLSEKSKKGIFSGLKMRKQKSVGDLEKRGTGASGSIRSTVSTASWISTGSSQSILSQKSAHTESNASFTVDEEHLDPSVVETYMGEWKRDKRDGYGISERSDGLKYEGEWHNNKKHGYGVTTFRDGTVEEGKYKNNVLITSQKKKHLFLIRSRKFRERIEASIQSAQRASKIALQKADIAISRTSTARSKAEYADGAADHARIDCEHAVATAREFAPDFKPSVLERFERLRFRERFISNPDSVSSPTQMANKINGQPQPQMKPQQSLQQQQQHQQQQQLQQQQQQQQLLQQQQHQQQQQQLHQQQATSAYQQAQSNRRASLAKQQSYEYSVPSSMYSQQVSPQSDLTQHINKHQEQQQQMYAMHHQNQTSMNTSSYQMQQGQTNSAGINQQNLPSQSYNTLSVGTPDIRQSAQDIRNQIYVENYSNQGQQQHQQLNEEQSQMLNNPATSLRRGSRRVSDTTPKPMLGSIGQQSSIDHFDHYKRPPSRDNSVDRYARAASRLSGGLQSRAPSVDRTTNPISNSNGNTNNPTATNSLQDTPDRNIRASSQFRGATPVRTTGNGSIPTGTGGSRGGTPSLHKRNIEPVYSSPNQPFEDVLLRQRTLGQDIIPSPSQPKRTESLFVPPSPATAAGGGAAEKVKLKSVPINVTLQRKKSLPDFQELPLNTGMMSREEVSMLGSARREEVRRQIENNERLKANPLLYLVSPQVKDWFSRQQLVLLVLIVNIVLAIMFVKMLT